MKKTTFQPVLSISWLFAALCICSALPLIADVNMACQPSIQGPPGPSGPRGPRGPAGKGVTGPTGPATPQIFASAYSHTQTLPPQTVYFINFDTNQYVPQGILHVPGSNTFTIETAGTYLINWSFEVVVVYFNAGDPSAPLGPQFLEFLGQLTSPNQAALFQPNNPATFEQYLTLPPSTETFVITLTGCSNLSLPAGTEIQLQAVGTPITTPPNSSVTYEIVNPMMSIVRIGNAAPLD